MQQDPELAQLEDNLSLLRAILSHCAYNWQKKILVAKIVPGELQGDTAQGP